MKLTEEQKKGRMVLHKIIEKAWESEEFKKELIAQPNETLDHFFGNSHPFSKKIIVTDQSNPDVIYINIPVKPLNK
jgi:hypothetical protein